MNRCHWFIAGLGTLASLMAFAHVEAEIQNHPLMDGFQAKLAQLKTRGVNAPHPFVVGADAYAAFLNVMSECAQARLARRTK